VYFGHNSCYIGDLAPREEFKIPSEKTSIYSKLESKVNTMVKKSRLTAVREAEVDLFKL
jgi:hypothetical protein